jgi:hypothetical protein
MQTFLPYSDFVQSAKVLDYRRLGKQRVEAMQLVNSTLKIEASPDTKVGWANHPARTMWSGWLPALKFYHNVVIQEWIDRGYNNNMKMYELPDTIEMPSWLGEGSPVHISHRSNLLRKDPVYYSQFGWDESPNIEYYWPSKAIM